MSSRTAIDVRAERPNDTPVIREILDGAFGGTAESKLVDALRAGGHLPLAQVACDGAKLVGYAAWPRLLVESPAGLLSVVGLAPLGVAPSHQGIGIGSALVRAGLVALRSRGESLVFVLGDPAYYRKFGFSLEAARAFESTYAGEHFMALALAAHAPDHGRVRYPAPFDAL